MYNSIFLTNVDNNNILNKIITNMFAKEKNKI